jgi:hypothetical protein
VLIGKPGSSVADRDRVQHLFGEHAEAGTEDHRHARRKSWLTGANDLGGFEWGIAGHEVSFY